ncbi:Hypothetical protein CAP_7756 [Chondromyces apiculatus DSM 436]|uniref:Uncharacterized protein n=1 Tax=Chondromyces apiculatus DSM 436 TaxID=1192034 RepID=A0A017SXV4_9BACT|nr:Hypothetical protein CAP_7756 [Chondromyces apiculatus DSM 436]
MRLPRDYSDAIDVSQPNEAEDTRKVLAIFGRIRQFVFEKYRHARRDAHGAASGRVPHPQLGRPPEHVLRGPEGVAAAVRCPQGSGTGAGEGRTYAGRRGTGAGGAGTGAGDEGTGAGSASTGTGTGDEGMGAGSASTGTGSASTRRAQKNMCEGTPERRGRGEEVAAIRRKLQAIAGMRSPRTTSFPSQKGGSLDPWSIRGALAGASLR